MSTPSETGHAKNVANLLQLNSIVISYGAAYNPSKPAIKIPALQLLAANAQNALTVLNVAMSDYKNATAAREVAFLALSPLATRAMNALKATDTTTQVDDNAKTLLHKILGQKASRKTPKVVLELKAEETEKKGISTSQMSFDNRLANMDSMITLFESVPEYIPNEEDIKPAALRAFHTSLKAKNDAAVTTGIAFSNARIVRNDILYKPLTGLVDLSVDVKNYIKSVYGAKSPQYKQVSGLIFKAVKK